MAEDKISKVISQYIDDGYVIQCDSINETTDTIHRLKAIGYKFFPDCISYTDAYSEGYPDVGLVSFSNTVNLYRRSQTLHPTVKYSYIVNDITEYDDIDDDNFESMVSDLLS